MAVDVIILLIKSSHRRALLAIMEEGVLDGNNSMPGGMVNSGVHRIRVKVMEVSWPRISKGPRNKWYPLLSPSPMP